MECSNIPSDNSLLIKILNLACPQLLYVGSNVIKKKVDNTEILSPQTLEFLIPCTKEMTVSSVAANSCRWECIV